MITQNVINEVKNRLISTYKPIEIYLFGSYAWGTPHEDSDLDLLIVIEKYDKDLHQVMMDGHRALADLDISKDIVVYSKEEFAQFSKDRTRFCYKVKHDGRKIYTAKA